jgi:hypothetical protein
VSSVRDIFGRNQPPKDNTKRIVNLVILVPPAYSRRVFHEICLCGKTRREAASRCGDRLLSMAGAHLRGLAGLWLYSGTPGKEGTPPDAWPSSSSLRPTLGASTLVMFLHPQCPCSRASIYELAILLAHSSGHLRAEVVFLKPPGREDSWTHTDLWQDASKLPATVTISDLGGREAALFKATTSGETVVHDTAGKLRFHGGITGARGHIGDNAGCSAIEVYANAGFTATTRPGFSDVRFLVILRPKHDEFERPS